MGIAEVLARLGCIPSFKNRGRHAHAFPGGVAGSDARPLPHPIEETTNMHPQTRGLQEPDIRVIRGHLLRIAFPKLATNRNLAKPTTKAIKQL